MPSNNSHDLTRLKIRIYPWQFKQLNIGSRAMNIQLTDVLTAHIVVPFAALVLDYLTRGKGVLECLKRSGPDLCLFGLGSTGLVFIDPKVMAAFPLPQPYLVLVVLLILSFRQLCFRLETKPLSAWSALPSCAFGLSSIAIVSSILYYSYTR